MKQSKRGKKGAKPPPLFLKSSPLCSMAIKTTSRVPVATSYGIARGQKGPNRWQDSMTFNPTFFYYQAQTPSIDHHDSQNFLCRHYGQALGRSKQHWQMECRWALSVAQAQTPISSIATTYPRQPTPHHQPPAGPSSLSLTMPAISSLLVRARWLGQEGHALFFFDQVSPARECL